MSTTFSVNNKTDIIDPEHVVVRDLFIVAYTSNTALPKINYLVELEEVRLTDDQAVLQLIKEVSQNV